MSVDLADNGNRLLWDLVYPSGEIVQFGMATGLRDAAEYPDVVTAMRDFLLSISDSGAGAAAWIAGYLSWTARIQEWQNPLFSADYWGTVYETGFTDSDGGLMAPPQISCVLSIISTDGDLNAARRRNRSYIGRIRGNRIGSDGLYNVASVTNLGTAVQALSTDLDAVPLGSGVDTGLTGLCQVSYAGKPGLLTPAQITAAATVRIGIVPDTQRRRRNAINEAFTDFAV